MDMQEIFQKQMDKNPDITPEMLDQLNELRSKDDQLSKDVIGNKALFFMIDNDGNIELKKFFSNELETFDESLKFDRFTNGNPAIPIFKS